MTKTEAKLILAAAEINELNKDLLFAILSPPTNTKIQTIAGCSAGLSRATERLASALAEIEAEMTFNRAAVPAGGAPQSLLAAGTAPTGA